MILLRWAIAMCSIVGVPLEAQSQALAETAPVCSSADSSTSDVPPFDLTVVGPFCFADGVARQPLDLIESLKDVATISFIPTNSFSPENMALLSPKVQEIFKFNGTVHPGRILIYENILSFPPQDRSPQGPYWARYGLPEKDKRQIRYAYSMFESTLVPREWVHILNNTFDALLVPDEFLVPVYQNSGVLIPIFVLPLGRDLEPFLREPLKERRGHPFVFANFSSCIPRKNLLTLLRAFSEAFGNDQNVRLYLGWREYVPMLVQQIKDEVRRRGLTNVILDTVAVSDEVYRKRFLGVDCYVNIATGEGFSIPPREAMALGIPTIVTDNTGQHTICKSDLVRVVPSNIAIPPLYTFAGDFGNQYQCTVQDVVAALRDVYDHYDTYLSNAPQARWWASQYQYQRLAPQYMALIKPKKVILGDENKILDDGVMTTSSTLVQKYQSIGLLAPNPSACS